MKIPETPLSSREIVQIIVEIAKGPERAMASGLVPSKKTELHIAYGHVVKQACCLILVQLGYSVDEIAEMIGDEF